MKEKGGHLCLPFSLTASYCYLPGFLVLKDLLQCYPKDSGNPEGQLNRKNIFSLLEAMGKDVEKFVNEQPKHIFTGDI